MVAEGAYQKVVCNQATKTNTRLDYTSPSVHLHPGFRTRGFVSSHSRRDDFTPKPTPSTTPRHQQTHRNETTNKESSQFTLRRSVAIYQPPLKRTKRLQADRIPFVTRTQGRFLIPFFSIASLFSSIYDALTRRQSFHTLAVEFVLTSDNNFLLTRK
jgi:hypothetical protein